MSWPGQARAGVLVLSVRALHVPRLPRHLPFWDERVVGSSTLHEYQRSDDFIKQEGILK